MVDAPLKARSHDANTARAHTQGVRVDHEDDFQGETAPVFYQTPSRLQMWTHNQKRKGGFEENKTLKVNA